MKKLYYFIRWHDVELFQIVVKAGKEEQKLRASYENFQLYTLYEYVDL